MPTTPLRTAPEVRILGPVEVHAAGTVTSPPSRTQRQLIAMLATAVGRTVGAERLADLLELSPGALRTAVARVRRLLGPAGVTTVAGSYRLDVTVDVDELERLAGPGTDGPSARLAALDRAWALVRGEPLSGFRDDSWALPAVARLDELVCHVAEERGATLLELDRASEAVAAMEELVRRHPLRDRAHGVLIRAYAADGRQTDALRVYRDYHRLLADELGTTPSPAVRRLVAQVSSVEDVPAPTAVPDDDADGHVGRAALPRYRSSFVGRTRDLTATTDDLSGHGLVTVTGPPGVGKTRLAAAVASHLDAHGQRVWFVELARARHDDDVHRLVAERVDPHRGGEEDPVALLRGRAGVLVVDNAEHVLGGVAALVDELATACPDVAVLVTSRERLGADGERVRQLEPLGPGVAGRELFEQRAREAGVDLQPGDRALVSEICARVDGLPLAIEIVAPLARTLGLRALRDELHHGLGFLDVPGPRSPDRHRTLNAAIAWSYRLLDEDQQRVLRTVAIFPGGFETAGVTEVLNHTGLPARRVVPLLSRLVDRSLVVGVGQSTSRRMHLLDTIRAFGLRELEAQGELGAARDALADWVTTMTDTGDRDLYSRDCHRASVRLERELDSWRAAADHAVASADADLAARLCGAPAQMLLLARPGLETQVRALDALLPGDSDRRAALGSVLWAQGMAHNDATIIDRSLALLERADPDDTIGTRRLLMSAHLILHTADVAEATRLRLELADDEAVGRDTRDHVLANALYGVCVASDEAGAPSADLVQRVREVAGRTDVPATHQLAHLALAWATRADDPDTSLVHLDIAAAEDGPIPLLLRRIWSASVARTMIASDPQRAAALILDLLREQIVGEHPDDTTVLVTAAALLAHVDHPCADDAAASVADKRSSANLARSVDEVESRIARGRVLHPDDLVPVLAGALADVAEGAPVIG